MEPFYVIFSLALGFKQVPIYFRCSVGRMLQHRFAVKLRKCFVAEKSWTKRCQLWIGKTEIFGGKLNYIYLKIKAVWICSDSYSRIGFQTCVAQHQTSNVTVHKPCRLIVMVIFENTIYQPHQKHKGCGCLWTGLWEILKFYEIFSFVLG